MPRTGDILGYARVSTADQDLSGQKDRLLQHGAVRVFEDVISGKTFNRPGLAALLISLVTTSFSSALFVRAFCARS